MPIKPEKMAEMTDLARDVMYPVLKVAARRLVHSMEEIHDSEIKPLRDALSGLLAAARKAASSAPMDADLFAACEKAETALTTYDARHGTN